MNTKYKSSFNGVFLTHAHIGHYTGLMYLGKEALGAKNTPVYAMSRMSNFLIKNGPWSQLVSQSNIELINLNNDQSYNISDDISVKPVLVPHRDEFSETVAYQIESLEKKILFIPDIDKWSSWPTSLKKIVKSTDFLFIDLGSVFKTGIFNIADLSVTTG